MAEVVGAEGCLVSIPKRGFGGFSPQERPGVSQQDYDVSIPKRGFGGFSPIQSFLQAGRD